MLTETAEDIELEASVKRFAAVYSEHKDYNQKWAINEQLIFTSESCPGKARKWFNPLGWSWLW